MRHAPLLAALLVLSAPLVAGAQNPPAPLPAAPSPPIALAAIENGSTVQIEFTMTDEAGQVLSTNKGLEPLAFTQGASQIVLGLERRLVGMRAGDVTKVVLKPEEAFGLVDPQALAEVPKEALPPGALMVGAQLVARDAAGEGRPAVVKEIRDTTVLIDLNHPLAGRTVVFDVRIVAVDPPRTAGRASGEAKPGQ